MYRKHSSLQVFSRYFSILVLLLSLVCFGFETSLMKYSFFKLSFLFPHLLDRSCWEHHWHWLNCLMKYLGNTVLIFQNTSYESAFARWGLLSFWVHYLSHHKYRSITQLQAQTGLCKLQDLNIKRLNPVQMVGIFLRHLQPSSC